jgi:N-acetylneuraminic acid mutarotase
MFDPANATWRAITNAAAPEPREGHVAAWTGERVIVWGGYSDQQPLNGSSMTASGGVYDPRTNAWRAMSTTNVPPARAHAASAWSGDRLLVLGGFADENVTAGGLYDPASDSWHVVVVPASFNTTHADWVECGFLLLGWDFEAKRMDLWWYEPPPRTPAG